MEFFYSRAGDKKVGCKKIHLVFRPPVASKTPGTLFIGGFKQM
jgi:hypothetical protein